MLYTQIVRIKDALTELGKERLPYAYMIAKNIIACEKIVNESNTIIDAIKKTYADKDEKGEVKLYNENGNSFFKITDPDILKTAQIELDKATAEDHPISFFTMPLEKIKDLSLPANVLVPLLGTVILEDEPKKS